MKDFLGTLNSVHRFFCVPTTETPAFLDALAAAQLNTIGRWTTSTSGDVQRHTVGKEAAFGASCNFHLGHLAGSRPKVGLVTRQLGM